MSEEQVKQYLFKARNRLKTGVATLRTLGEKSFNPAPFSIYFYGKGNNSSTTLFKRKAPGNILLECYYSPMTLEALSLELGIAVAYLEDEIADLIAHDLLVVLPGEKYQANLVIFTDVFEAEFQDQQAESGVIPKLVNTMTTFFTSREKDLETCLGAGLHTFTAQGKHHTAREILKWRFVAMALYHMMIEDFLKSYISKYPELFNGMRGYRWGLQKKYGDKKYDFGILGHHGPDGAKLISMNFAHLKDRHRALTEQESAKLLIKLAQLGSEESLTDPEHKALIRQWQREGILQEGTVTALGFPALDPQTHPLFLDLISPLSAEFSTCAATFCQHTASLLHNHVPRRLRGELNAIAALKQVEGMITSIMEGLEGWLCDPYALDSPIPIEAVINLFVLS